ncbi:MAG: tRNA (adenosine(37)-N6)-threonylcarbamoyltransferase complex dimerization subunit type 1 TsaB [Acidobacteriaceae bacterium]|nr:tRNA (adenosine(37)-N6)-threonylcarbamoyltransferase complex dimerization subunit type 1 TsaB [Acidobacteriaceae bacterium]
MKMLLLDLCGAGGTLALADDGREPAVFAQSELASRSAAATLLPAILALLKQATLSVKELDAIAIVHGPGSFTGVRIGVSAAKGLSEGAGVPVIAVSRLAVLAGMCTGAQGRVYAALDAGRGEFYVRASEPASQRVSGSASEAMLTREELAALLAEAPGTVCVCEAKVGEALAEFAPVMVAEPAAGDAYALTAAEFAAARFADVAALDANYLRRADAEMLEKQRAAMAARRAEAG